MKRRGGGERTSLVPLPSGFKKEGFQRGTQCKTQRKD